MARKSWRGEWKLGPKLGLGELAQYGIEEEMACAVITSGETALECVKIAPELHIVSMIKDEKGYFYNRYIPDADAYYLTDGDPNPELFQVAEPPCLADIDEFEQDIREASGGQLSPFDQSFFRFLRMVVTNTFSLDALVDPEHRRRVRERTGEPPAGPLLPRKRALG